MMFDYDMFLTLALSSNTFSIAIGGHKIICVLL